MNMHIFMNTFGKWSIAVISAAAKVCTFRVDAFRARTIIRSVLYRNQYCVYHIKSYRLLLYRGKPDSTCIAASSADVNESHTASARSARHLIIHHTGGGWIGGRRKETVALYQHLCDTKSAEYWVLATSNRWCHTSSNSRKWWKQSQLSIT